MSADPAPAFGHDSTVTALAASAEHGRVATGDMGGGLILWTVDPLAPEASLAPPGGERGRVRDLAFSAGGALAVATDWTGAVEVWKGGTLVHGITAYTGQATAVAWTASGLLVTGGGDEDPDAPTTDDPLGDSAPAQLARIKLWSGSALKRSLAAPAGGVRVLAISPDDRWVAAGIDAQVVVWQIDDGVEVARFEGPGEVTGLGFGKSGLVVAGARGLLLAPGAPPQPGVVRDTVRAPAAAWVGDERVAVGDYEAVRIYGLPDLQPLGSVPGRAYAATRVGDEIWAALSDKLLRVDLQGSPRGERSVRVP